MLVKGHIYAIVRCLVCLEEQPLPYKMRTCRCGLLCSLLWYNIQPQYDVQPLGFWMHSWKVRNTFAVFIIFQVLHCQFTLLKDRVIFILNNQCHNCWLRGLGKLDISSHGNVLTLNVRGPSYLGLTRSISWLLMPWLLTSPGHQQLWYWLCKICRSWSNLRTDFKYLCQINVE